MNDVSEIDQAEFVKLQTSDKNGIEQGPVGSTAYKDQRRSWVETNFTEENTDAFGRVRASYPTSIFDCSFRFDLQPQMFNSLSTNGSVTYDSDKVSAVLATTSTASGAISTFQTFRRFAYHPGKSQLVSWSCNFNAGTTNCEKRIGQFSANNGFFFTQKDGTFYVSLRSKVSGSVADTDVAQSSWNLDKLDGSGPSGITLDVTKQNIFLIDYQWLGSGRIRYGVNIGGKIIYCHQINNANLITTPYSQTASLPFTAQILNNGISSATNSLSLTCLTISCEGQYSPEGITRGASNGITLKAITSSLTPVLAIRKQSSFLQAIVQILKLSIYISTNTECHWHLIWNPTITGGSYVAQDGYCEVNTTATSLTGGFSITEGYVNGNTASPSVENVPLTLDSVNTWIGTDLNNNSDIICIAIQTLGGNANVVSALTYKEIV